MEEKNYSYGKRPLWQWIVIYVLIGAVIYGLVYYFVLAKKGGYSYNQPAYPTQQPAAQNTTQMTNSHELTVQLQGVKNSWESGIATLTEENGKVTVNLNLGNSPPKVAQPAHIHIGTCPGVGEVKYPLSNVVDGKSKTVLAVTLDQLKKETPLAINVHKSTSEASIYVACGSLPSK